MFLTIKVFFNVRHNVGQLKSHSFKPIVIDVNKPPYPELKILTLRALAFCWSNSHVFNKKVNCTTEVILVKYRLLVTLTLLCQRRSSRPKVKK